MSEWQPIETAPKGEYVLVWQKGAVHPPCVALYGKCNFNKRAGWFSDLYHSASEFIPFQPTHWKPIELPETES